MASAHSWQTPRQCVERRPVAWACRAAVLGMAATLLQAGLAAPQTDRELSFNPDFLRTPVDLGLFARGNPVPPGRQRVEVFVNGQGRGRHDLMFVPPQDGGPVATPCFDARLLAVLGIQVPARPTPACELLATWVPGAVASHDATLQQVELQVPQASLRRRRLVPEAASWDDGIPAARLLYDYAAFAAGGAGHPGVTSHHLGLRAGLNAGCWRANVAGGLGRATGTGGLQSARTTAQLETALPAWNSRVVLGDTWTDAQVFEGLSLRGVRLASEPRMLPEGGGAGSPAVRGLALSHALVTVRQQQQRVAQVAVPPGPFLLDDLPVGQQGGDLEVTVTEADGAQQQFTVPHSPSPETLPPGRWIYSLAWGAWQAPGPAEGPGVAVATARFGLSGRITVNGGVVASSHYQAVSAGLATGSVWGALSGAWTHSRNAGPGGEIRSGGRLSFRQVKTLPQAGASLSVSGWADAGRGFADPALALTASSVAPPVAAGGGTGLATAMRARLWLSATVASGRFGSLSALAGSRWRWGVKKAEPELLLSGSQQIGPATLVLTLARSSGGLHAPIPFQAALSLSMPLDGAPGRPLLTAAAVRSRGGASFNTSLSGQAGEGRSVNYTTFVAAQRSGPGPHEEGAESTGLQSAGAFFSWAAPRAQVGVGVSAAPGGGRQISASASGGLVGYAGGWVASRELGETLALVEARDAGGAALAGWPGLRLDAAGRGVVPHLQPYRANDVGVDPQGLPWQVGLVGGVRQVVPTAGAVVLQRFETRSGQALLVDGRLASGRPLPFGAVVRDASGQALSHVAQGGQALLRLAQPQGRLRVEWGAAQAERCSFEYRLPAHAPGAVAAGGLHRLDVLCE